jgi:hypothetical protein
MLNGAEKASIVKLCWPLEVKDPVLYKLVNDLDDAERDGLKSLLKDIKRTKAKLNIREQDNDQKRAKKGDRTEHQGCFMFTSHKLIC